MHTFVIPDRFNTANAQEVALSIQPLVDAEPFVILDFTQCSYISSMGIRILLTAKKQLLKKQGELFLCGLCPAISYVLESAGMTTLFAIHPTVEKAEQALEALVAGRTPETAFSQGDVCFKYAELGGGLTAIRWGEATAARSGEATPSACDTPLLATLKELTLAVGNGAPADGIAFDAASFQPFVALGRCAAFPQCADFRLALDPSQAGVYLSQAVSFGPTPTGCFTCEASHGIPLGTLWQAAATLRHQRYPAASGPILCLVFDKESDPKQMSVALLPDNDGQKATGTTFLLNEWRATPDNDPVSMGSAQLAFDNILDVMPSAEDNLFVHPRCYIYVAANWVDCDNIRLAVQVAGEEPPLPLYLEFLARRIYTDSAKIVVTKLHGGFSAQTFHVASFDADGRRLRPTVMKVADKAMIERESTRCQQYAQPYILNNSAQILGTAFFEDKGALRYNFVGIGGGDSKLQWLTHIYQKESFEDLEPLFDKIFLKILHPWYGQATRKPLFLFLDHDPTLTFFPHIFETARTVLGIDSAEKKVYINELGREALNPYWYLQHVFPTHRKQSMETYAGICHGDLNMQNILVDENKNIYLIDFSETKMRAAISDFARLEAILLLENAPFTSEDTPDSEAYVAYAHQLASFYEAFQTLETPVPGHSKNFLLTGKMRQYALLCVHGNNNALPYRFALLEWILPIVCYGSASPSIKRLSFVVSALLMEQVAQENRN